MKIQEKKSITPLKKLKASVKELRAKKLKIKLKNHVKIKFIFCR